MRPRLVICDEPVSALDLSVQAQVLNLLRELQHDFHLSYLFIAHDLPVVRHLSHRIIVLYRGRVMEDGDPANVYNRPSHPCTHELSSAAPMPDPEVRRQRRAARKVGLRDSGDVHRAVFSVAPGSRRSSNRLIRRGRWKLESRRSRRSRRGRSW